MAQGCSTLFECGNDLATSSKAKRCQFVGHNKRLVNFEVFRQSTHRT